MKLEQQPIDQQSMKLEQQLFIWSWNNNYWSTGKELSTTTTDQQGTKLENYWSTGNEVRTITIDQQGMKLEQHLLTTGNIDQRGMRLEQQLLTNRELN